jgi:LPXTG-site transpeptidase (sortase) family protein
MSQYPRKKSISVLDLVWYYKFRLAFYIVAISFLSFAFLYAINAVPAELQSINETSDTAQAATIDNASSTPSTSASTTEAIGELPERVVIQKIGVDTVVNNPDTTDSDTLDADLLRGAVRYPTSGTLGSGNVLIFGHSTSLPVVNNQAYKTFVGLKNLNIGDEIQVFSSDKEYDYSVISVTLEDSDQAYVNFSGQGMLTLSTCDVFGEKQQRFVVQASFVSSHSL